MKELICKFGQQANLTGVYTQPDAAPAHPSAPTVLILNAGLLHHVGPHRISVDLARRLAALGIASLRFDLGGRGDSEPPAGTKPDEEQVLIDIADAMNYLGERRDARQFILFGLCAGADNAHAAAIRDRRVVGVVQLDGHGYRTWCYYLVHYAPRLLRLSAWMNFLRQRFSPPKDLNLEGGELATRRPFGPREAVRGEVQSLVDRGVDLLYLYTGGVADLYFNHRRQFQAMFGGLQSRGRIEVEYYPRADHTYTFREDRERMFERVIGWLQSRSNRAGGVSAAGSA